MNPSPFEQAQEDVKKLSRKPGNETMLKLYGLYKQGSEGDVSGDRPEAFDFVASAKYDAWAAQEGKSQETAQQEYVALVEQLRSRES